MRHLQRAVIALLATALLGLVPFAGLSSASADEERVHAGFDSVGTSELGRADARRQKRSVTIKGFVIKNGIPFVYGLKGWVGGGRTEVHLLRAGRYNGHYRKIATDRTNRRHMYRFAPYRLRCNQTVYYRVHVPRSKRFYAAWSKKYKVWLTCS